jgi:hypothetical protein
MLKSFIGGMWEVCVMAAMFTDDPEELNKRYMPKDEDLYEDYEDEDEGEEIPEEELTEEEREMINTLESWPEKTWHQIFEGLMDEEDYTLSDEEYSAKNILAKLNTTNPSIDYGFKLAILKLVTPKDAVHIIKRLQKKPEEGANIPPEMLEMIYTKAKEYKG